MSGRSLHLFSNTLLPLLLIPSGAALVHIGRVLAREGSGGTTLRPTLVACLLTTLTTFFGLLPMIFETSRQAKFLIPMAISLGFGILFATGITLVLIPSLCMILNDAHERVASFMRMGMPKDEGMRLRDNEG